MFYGAVHLVKIQWNFFFGQLGDIKLQVYKRKLLESCFDGACDWASDIIEVRQELVDFAI